MKNKYDELFDFRIATIDDVDNIMKFLKEEWGEHHILANDKEFFLYQYGGTGNQINVYLMLDKQGGIQGINGYILYSQDPQRRYISSAITKVKADLPIPMCGIELIKRFKQYTLARAYFSSGTNPDTMLPIGKRVFKYHVGLMQQYYCLNRACTQYKIAAGDLERYHDIDTMIQKDSNVSFEEVQDLSQLDGKFDFDKKYPKLAFKSKEYFTKRFFEHPIYHYHAYAIYDNQKCYGILFMRKVDAMNSSAIRIVDYIGDLEVLGHTANAMQKLLITESTEYIDFLQNGISGEILNRAGFLLRETYDTIIIPTYFEPFEQKNINIHYQSSDENLVIFKADGDQDRPNYRR